jgi:hypothetical protein
MHIVLITPTGARERQIQLCAQWMKQQTYTGDVTWIIVDDAEPVTTDFIPAGRDNFRDNWHVTKIHPTPAWQPGQNTQGRNINAGINYVMAVFDGFTVDGIFIIEDDDYYSPAYLDEMMKRLPGFDAIGETNTIYYNVMLRRWIENHNDTWSSLFQTAFTMKSLRIFKQLLTERFIDYAFFPAIENKLLFRAGNLAVGIKGQPGRAGIGAGHGWIKHLIDDADGRKLIELLGDDAKYYM